MSIASYTMDADFRPRFGLIVLQVDETIEQDFRHLIPSYRAGLFVTRVPSGAKLTPDTIARMEVDLPSSARLLPAPLDVVGYACTSGATLIGPDRIAQLVRDATGCALVTNPMTAAIARCHALGLQKIGIVSPYIASVATPICAAFEQAGIVVADTLSFGEEREAHVARITPFAIAEAARHLAHRTALDGLFLSCTNLRSLECLAPLSQELGVPVLSSNQCLAWHMQTLAGLGTDAWTH